MSEDTKSAPAGERQDETARRNGGNGQQSGAPASGQAADTDPADSQAVPQSPAGGDAGEDGEPGRMEADEQAGDGGTSQAEEADAQSLMSQLEAAQAEIAEHKDRYMRAAAEAENIRRRADNDIASARKFAIEGFASEILAVRDSLEIANSLEIKEDDAGAVAKMKEGLELTLKQLDNALSKFSIEAVEPDKGDKLDPERHQAMSTQESENVEPNHIVSVIQKGYMIHDRLLRPAMVVVARKPAGDSPPGDTGSNERTA